MGQAPNYRPTSSSSLSLKLLVIAMAAMEAVARDMVFNVLNYGAVANGKIDNSKAFARAWEEACEWDEGSARVLIPGGNYLTGPVSFMGPCRSPIEVHLRGIVQAPSNLHAFHTSDWVVFKYLSKLTITGNGRFHGQGDVAWSKNDCSSAKSKYCRLPISIKLASVEDSLVQGISSVDSKLFHFLVFKCNNIHFRNVRISAPGDSPNTDGIHISTSTNVYVTDSNIATGDDCISIGPGNNGIFISNVLCGPGHGISVGSLGKRKQETDVTNVRVTKCTFTRTTNGVRIKSWKDSHVLSASNFLFDDLIMKDVYNPIIIDQEYCPGGGCTNKPPSRVKINNVKFANIRGTSTSEVALTLRCSKSVPCRDIKLGGIHLTYSGDRMGVVAKASCSNVIGTSYGTMIPPSCI